MLNRQDKIDFLRQYRRAFNIYLSLIAERDEWLSFSLGSASSQGEPVKSSNPNPSKVALAAEQRDAMIVEIEREMSRCRAARLEVSAVIENIEHEQHQRVLRLVYINGFSWAEVEANTGYCVRQARRLHDQALDELYLDVKDVLFCHEEM